MLKLLLFTGMRNAELVHLRPTDIDLQTCQVCITQGKGGRIPFFRLGGSPEQLGRRSLTNPVRQGSQESNWSTYFGEMP